MNRRVLIALGGAVIGATLMVAGILSPVQQREPTRLPDVATLQMGVCPVQGAAGELIGAGAAGTSARTLAGQVLASSQVNTTVVVSQSQSGQILPPGVLLTSSGGRSFAACSDPASTSAVQVADASKSDILLVNPDKTPAVVNLALHSVNGSLTSAGSRGLTVAPGEVRSVPISVLAPGRDPVTVVQTATQGRVVMVSRVVDGSLDQMAAQQPAPEQIIAGLPASSTRTRLVIGNPSQDRVQVDVHAMNGRGEYVPAGTENVSIDPSSTVVLDLTGSLNSEATALRVTSESTGIVASAEVTVGADTALVGSLATGSVIDDVPASSVVQLVNPGKDPITVKVVSAGKTTQVKVAAHGAAGTQVQAGVRLTMSVISPKPAQDTPLVLGAASIIGGSGVAVQDLRPTVTRANQTQIDQDPRLG